MFTHRNKQNVNNRAVKGLSEKNRTRPPRQICHDLRCLNTCFFSPPPCFLLLLFLIIILTRDLPPPSFLKNQLRRSAGEVERVPAGVPGAREEDPRGRRRRQPRVSKPPLRRVVGCVRCRPCENASFLSPCCCWFSLATGDQCLR